MKFVIFKDKKGEFRWKLITKNRKSVAVSGEGYKIKSGAVKAINKIREDLVFWESPQIIDKT